MNAERFYGSDTRIQQALAELKGLISERYPAARFWVTAGDDPEGAYLKTMVDVEDTEEIVDVFIERMLTLQIEEGLPVYVVPIRPSERVAQLLHDQAISCMRFKGGAAFAP